MKKLIYCCDICGKELENYNPEKDCISLLPGEQTAVEEVVDPINETRDLCLHCLATIVVLEYKVAGIAASQKFINLIDKRAKGLQK